MLDHFMAAKVRKFSDIRKKIYKKCTRACVYEFFLVLLCPICMKLLNGK